MKASLVLNWQNPPKRDKCTRISLKIALTEYQEGKGGEVFSLLSCPLSLPPIFPSQWEAALTLLVYPRQRVLLFSALPCLRVRFVSVFKKGSCKGLMYVSTTESLKYEKSAVKDSGGACG